MTAFFAPIPSNFDPSLAPPGCQMLNLGTAAPRGGVARENSDEEWIDALLKIFFRYFPEAEKHVMWIETHSTRFLANWLGKTHGPIISNSQVPGQVAGKRLPNSTPVRGLYLAGDNAGGRGIGTELACQSGMDCADLILSDMEHRII